MPMPSLLPEVHLHTGDWRAVLCFVAGVLALAGPEATASGMVMLYVVFVGIVVVELATSRP